MTDESRTPKPEEIEVIRLMVQGWTDERIARHLEISLSTVKRRIYRASQALGVTSRAGLASRATRLGLIDDSDGQSARGDR